MNAQRVALLREILNTGRLLVDMERGTVTHTKTGRVMGQYSGRRYLNDGLSYKGKVFNFLIHEVIAFVGGFDLTNKCVNHINGDKTDNRISNLEVVSQQENVAHAIRTGLTIPRGEGSNANTKLTEADVKEIRLLSVQGLSQRKIAERFNIHQSHVYLIVHRKSWAHVS